MPEVPSLFQSLAMGLVRAKITEFKPDLRRIYGLGISMGGYGIWDMACRMNDLFAAIAVMCGGADTSQAPNLRHVAAFLIHGADDSAVPVIRAATCSKQCAGQGIRMSSTGNCPESIIMYGTRFLRMTKGWTGSLRRDGVYHKEC